MKKANQLLILCLLISIAFSCKKDGETAAIGPSVVGKWKDGGTKGSMTIDFLGQKATEPLDVAATNEIIEFKSDGTISNLSAPGGDTELTKYKTSGNQLILTGVEAGKSFDFILNYSLNGNTLLLSMDKALFAKNIVAIAAAGGDSELADFKEFATFITDLSYTQTLTKQ